MTTIRPSISRMFAVGPGDDRVLFTCGETGRKIVVFFGHPRVAMIEKRAGEIIVGVLDIRVVACPAAFDGDIGPIRSNPVSAGVSSNLEYGGVFMDHS